MKTTIRTVLVILLGLFLGSAVNMGLIMIGGSIVPPPGGADVTTMEGLKASLHLFQPQHFIFPFLAHALGTIVGAYSTALLVKNNKKIYALSIGFFFLIGGLINVFMLQGPLWFTLIDLIAAYLPMAWLGWKMVPKKLS